MDTLVSKSLDDILGVTPPVRVGMWVMLPSWNKFYEVVGTEEDGSITVICSNGNTARYTNKWSKMEAWVVKPKGYGPYGEGVTER